MTDYISREAAIKELCASKVQGANTIRLKLNSIPATDVKPVVRCKDCKHHLKQKSSYLGDPIPCSYCLMRGIDVSYDFYCADGERRDANDER